MKIEEKNSSSLELEEQFRESLRRCSEETVEAAIEYRRCGDSKYLPTIVLGIIERFVEPEFRSKLSDGDDDIRVVEDLGVDSLMMLEIVMLVEETLNLSIQNDELLELKTLGDVKTLIHCKIEGIPMPERPMHLVLEEIAAIVPYQHPFLFLHEAVIKEDEAEGLYRIQGDEVFLEGHFKENPVFPASIMIEALGQLAVLFLIKNTNAKLGGSVDPNQIMFGSCDGVRCYRVCKPGDALDLRIKLCRVRKPLAVFEGAITTVGERVAFIQELALTFKYKE